MDQENLILIEREKKIKIQQEKLDRDREDIKKRELEIQKMIENEEKNQKIGKNKPEWRGKEG